MKETNREYLKTHPACTRCGGREGIRCEGLTTLGEAPLHTFNSPNIKDKTGKPECNCNFMYNENQRHSSQCPLYSPTGLIKEQSNGDIRYRSLSANESWAKPQAVSKEHSPFCGCKKCAEELIEMNKGVDMSEDWEKSYPCLNNKGREQLNTLGYEIKGSCGCENCKTVNLVKSLLDKERQLLIEEILEYKRNLGFLYGDKLPFVVWQGKADEQEKITIYEQAFKDIVGLLRNNKSN